MKQPSILIRTAAVVAALLTAPLAHAQVSTNIAYAKRDMDNDFYPDDITTTFIVHGRITSPSFATNRAEFYIQDTNNNAAIQVIGSAFQFNTNTYQLGYEVSAEGQISQSNGVRAINPIFEFLLNVTDPTPVHPTPYQVTVADLLANAETNESRLVEVTNVLISSGSWPAYGSSASLVVSDQTASITMRIDVDVGLDGQPAPTNAFTLRGILTQFDTSTNANSGYQILPRFYSDIIQDIGQAPPDLRVLNSNAIFSVAADEALAIRLLGTDPNGDDTLVFSAPTAPGGSTLDETAYREAQFNWTPTVGDRGTTNAVVLEVTDGVSTASVSLVVYVLTELQAAIVLNEVHWDPAAGANGDANGDGVRDALADEFVEIYNNSTNLIDFGGYTLLFGTNLLYVFPGGMMLTGETATVVFGSGQTPVGAFGNAQVFVSGLWTGGVNLANTPNTRNVGLVDSNGVQLFSYNYGSFGEPDQSITRSPDASGAYVLHQTANPAKRWSPGTLASGAGFPGSGMANTAPALANIADTYVRPSMVRTVAVSATDAELDAITLTVSNAPATAVFTDNGDGTGEFIYTGTVADAGTAFDVTVYASDGADAGTETFRLTVVASSLNGLRINEFLADPDATGIYLDTNNDGVTNNTQDEFVEILNVTTNSIDLAGFQLWDGTSLRHTFASVVLPTNGHIVVFGGGSVASFVYGPGVLASGGSLGLNNTGPETITLYTPQTTIVDQVFYDSAGSPPAAESSTLYPDGTGDFTNHLAANPALRASPGRRTDGTAFLSEQPPVLAAIGPKNVTENNSLVFAVSATDIDLDTITLVASNLPAGALFGATNGAGLFTWSTATPVGVYTTTFHAADNDGFDSETITITVTSGGGGSTNLLFVYEFGVSGSFTDAASSVASGLTLSPFSVSDGTFTTPGGNPGLAYSDNGWTGAVPKYFSFTVTVDAAYTLDIDGFLFDDQRSGSGPTNWFLRYSGNGFASDLAVGLAHSAIASSSNAASLSLTGLTGAIEFRLYATNTAAPSGTWRVDNVRMIGEAALTGGGNDADGDGIPNEWENSYFGGNTNATPDADDDGDGFVNLDEFIALTIPTNGNSFFAVEDMTGTVGRAILFNSATGRNYRIDITTNLLDGGGWTTLESGLPGTGGTLDFTDTNDAPNAVYRIGVQLQ